MLKKLLLAFAFICLFSTQSIFAQVNNCLSFDGTDDYVSIPASSDWVFGSGNFTVEWWQYITKAEIGVYPRIFSIGTNRYFEVSIEPDSNDKIYLFLNDGEIYAEISSYKNTWVHFAITGSAGSAGSPGTIKFYQNGTEIGSAQANWNISNSTYPLLLGKKTGASPTEYFGGKLDEFRIWNVARTQNQIQEYMNSTLGTRTGLLASYHFDEGTAEGNNSGVTTLFDKSSSGANHVGTLTNFALTGATSNWVSRVYPTAEDNCLQFDGTDDYVNLAGLSEEIDDADALTIEMWANVNTWGEDETLFSKYYNINSRTQIQEYTTGNLQITIEQGGTNDGTDSRAYTTTAPISTGNWFHLAMVYDGAGVNNADKLKLYINGQLVTLTYRGTINPDLNSTVQPALLGVQGAGLADALCNYFNGRMDEVRIWNIVRSQANIQAYMFTSLAGTESGLVAYYNFNQGTAEGSNSNVVVLNDLSVESDWSLTTSAKTFGVLTNFALSGSASNWISSFTPTGSGTSGDPYLIANLDNLNWLSLNSSKWGSYYKQTADIDASSSSTWDGNKGWSPIGNNTTNFTGTYDGDGHTISGLFINRSSTNYLGFFGKTNTGAVIQNLGLVDINIMGTLDYIGGLVGIANTSSISKCYSTGSVTGSTSSIGGLFGLLLQSNVANCYSTASVIGYNRTGGFVGEIGGGSLSYCYSKGLVTAGGPYVGGFTGNSNISITISFWDTETSGKATSAGGAGVVGKTTAEMITLSTFTSAGWDFYGESANGTNEIWNIGNGRNNGYPYFQWQYPADAALPVELTSLTASVSKGKVTIHWQTATEVNNYGFEIERAVNLRDLEDDNGNQNLGGFETIGFVEGHGNSNSIKEYLFTDNEITTGKYSYRLKQIDIDGSFSYSDIVEVELNELPKSFELSQNYPNPFNPSTTIKYSIPAVETPYMASLRVYDILGNEVATLVNESKPAGNYEVKFDASNLSSGIYFYQLNAGSFTATKKLILLK
ncbi:MAG: LamG-like jellyroll fold domain-containing protein [bacterium]